MMITRKKNKNWYIIKLCYKVIFFFEIPYVHTEYFPLSYKGALTLNRVGISIKKKIILYKFKRQNLLTIYNNKHVRGDFFYIYDYSYYFYINESRKLRYTGFLLNSKFSFFYYLLYRKIYDHYSFFFYSFFFKTCFFKKYHFYKNQHLINFLWNTAYSYDIIKNFSSFTKFQNFFSLNFEFYTNIFLNKGATNSFLYPIEFFFFKNKFFFKKKDNFIIKNNSFIFSEKYFNPTGIFNDTDNIFFFEKKYCTLNNFVFCSFKNKFYLNSIFLLQQILIYKNLQLLFINTNNKFF